MSKTQSIRLSITAVVMLLVLALAAPVSADGHVTVVADGLDNPRGLAFAPNGALYIAEAGTGGAGPCFEGPEGEEVCFGTTGAISMLRNGRQRQVVTGLPSLAEAGGVAATGPHDVSFRSKRQVFAVVGLGADPAVRDTDPALADLGTLVRFKQNKNSWRVAGDPAGYEAANDPDGAGADSNPYAVLAVPGGRLVLDAGGNDLLKFKARGGVQEVAVFPGGMAPAPPFLDLPPDTMIPYQSVPTSIAPGPDRAYYVGELTGFPFPEGGAKVWRVVPGRAPTVHADGFTHIIDLAFDDDGTLWVLQFSQASLLGGVPIGKLVEVAPDGTRTDHLAAGELFAPTGLAIDDDGAIYISNFGIFPGEDPGGFFPGTGEVLRYDP
jgi:sugar lactone lactonase YvrE